MLNLKNFSLPRSTGQYIISGTETFRLSCKKFLSSKQDKPWNNFGGNMQNLEKDMRIIYEADPGYSFVSVDQSGAEALIVAYLCRPGKYRQLFEHKVKPHTYIALKVFKDEWKKVYDQNHVDIACVTPIPDLQKLSFWKELDKLIRSSDNWESNRRFYHIGKKIVHASSYAMRGNTFALNVLKESGGTIVIPVKEAEKHLLIFHQEFPEIREWQVKTFGVAKNKRQLRNLLGFPYNITEFVNPDDYKDLIAWVPQSTVASITREAYCNLSDHIEKHNLDWHLVADTHDSYMAMVPEGDTLECAKIMKSLIEVELTSPVDGVKFKMRSEAQVGKNWAPRKEKKINEEEIQIINSNGLQEVEV